MSHVSRETWRTNVSRETFLSEKESISVSFTKGETVFTYGLLYEAAMRGAVFSRGSVALLVGTSHCYRTAPSLHNRKAEGQEVSNIPGCPCDNGIEPGGSPIL